MLSLLQRVKRFFKGKFLCNFDRRYQELINYFNLKEQDIVN